MHFKSEQESNNQPSTLGGLPACQKPARMANLGASIVGVYSFFFFLIYACTKAIQGIALIKGQAPIFVNSFGSFPEKQRTLFFPEAHVHLD